MKKDKDKEKKVNGSVDTSMYEIYYFSEKNTLELGCICNGTEDEVYTVAIENFHIGFSYFVVIKNDTFIFVSKDKLDTKNLWMEVFYYRHFEDFILLKNIKKEFKIRQNQSTPIATEMQYPIQKT